MKVAVYADRNRMEPIERAEYGGSVIRQMRDVPTFIAGCNRPSEKGIGMCACPEGSVKEAVANAIVHRDYSVDDAIRISICRTEMTITSPGALNRNYTEEELLMGVSSFRNRNLARVLQRLGLIETYGTGILRIVGSYRGTYVHPEIVAGPSTFTVVLPSMNTVEDSVQTFLDGREEFTRAEFEKGMGVSRSRAVATVNRLIEDGRIVRVGAGRAVRYRSDVAPRPRFRTVPGRRPVLPLITRVYARTRVQY